LSEVWYFFTNKVVICFDIDNLFFNLIKERTALKILLLLVIEENGEVVIALGKDINIDVPL
jgi:hypothetical protein